MKDKINKIFALIVRPHWGLYFSVSFLFGLVLFYFHPIPKNFRSDFLYYGLSFYVILPAVILDGISCRLFYSKEDKQFLDRRVRAGIPATDIYFYTKINSEVSMIRIFFGYVYVLTKVIAFGGFGFILAMSIYVVNKGL